MTDALLECVLAASDATAVAAWRRWRSAAAIESIPWRDALLVPMLPARRRELCQEGDPAAPILTGLVRRAWTQGEMMAIRARGLVALLRAAGHGPVMIGGSTAAFLQARSDGALRPVTDVTLLLPRHRLDAAVAVLRDDRWTPRTGIPPRRARSWASGMILERGADTLRVAWRHVGVPPWRTAAVERALFERPTDLLPADALIASRLSPEGGWDGLIPWQADAAHLAAGSIDWEAALRVARLAPEVDTRLRELHGVVAGVPPPSRRASPPIRLEHAMSRGLRRMSHEARRIMGRR